jgi:outer membrane protein TolC
MFGVSVSLPWFNRGKYRADLDRDRARAEARRAETADYELEVRRELFRLWTAIDAARRETELLGDQLIPRSELAVDTALAAWTTGRGGFLDLLEARRLLNDARADRLRALVEQHLMIAELTTCCGVGEVDALLMLADDAPSPTPTTPDAPPTAP